MRHQYGPHAWPHLWLWPYSIHGYGAFHSWPWRIPFMAMAHSTYGHGAFHSWPQPYSIHGHGPIPFMAEAPTYGQGPVTGASYSCTWQNVAIYPVSRSPGATPAQISRESIESGNQTLLALGVVPGGRYRRQGRSWNIIYTRMYRP